MPTLFPVLLGAIGAAPAVTPVVEIEEPIYEVTPADNGAGPLWCYGATCIVRVGEQVFVSGLETIPDQSPLNNVRWTLWRRDAAGWSLVRRDEVGRTREPCPLVALPDGRVLLSANPTLTAPTDRAGPARPEILAFDPARPEAPPDVLLPVWAGAPVFTEHSYRSFAADGDRGGMVLFNILGHHGYHWSYRDPDGAWSHRGELVFPWGADYEVPEAIRVCYPEIVLHGREVHFLGVSDIVEPVKAWREFKRELTGQAWDYDFRRLFYTWTPDLATTPFAPWVELASREQTCGWIHNDDLWRSPTGEVHALWRERSIDARLRERFFPDEKLTFSLHHAVLREGRVLRHEVLLEGGEGLAGELPGRARFHVTPERRLFVFGYVSGRDAAGAPVSVNRLWEVSAETASEGIAVPMERPLSEFQTATVRAGCPPSERLDLYGIAPGEPRTLRYARVRLDGLSAPAGRE